MSGQIHKLETAGNPGKCTFFIEPHVERQFIVYRPSNIPAETRTPLVFMFHGTSQDGEKFYEDSGWKEKADSAELTVVFPTSLKYHIVEDYVGRRGTLVPDMPRYTEKWNFLSFPSLLDPEYPGQAVYDDVAFVRQMVAYVLRNYAIEPRHIYASGFSNGGQFVGRLMVEMSNVFAAFSICGAPGTFYTERGAPLLPTPHPRPVMNLIGSIDPKICQGIGIESIPLDESAVADGFPLKDRIITYFLEELKLSDQYTYTPNPDLPTFEYADRLEPGPQVYLLAIGNNMGHLYLTADQSPNGIGAADLFWDFMSQYSLERVQGQ